MRIDDIDQEDADIDYFATDAAGHVLHVASGGGVLPESVAASQEDLLLLHQYFLTLPERGEAKAVEPGLQGNGPVRYARRGLFSFNKVRLHERDDAQYYIVARPTRPLTVAELPPPLAELLLRTRLPSNVGSLAMLDITAIS
ncbi:hypothetical protein HER32_05995 [Hymenobacter sp. BT18]|uniref:hypothetical protein n=1 Tax=Hymenobacter sp. BT18 TaxID=2835648 RepID=UPI00143E858F|nr:hypothetical protein [Hymenobacter sp. BT18]QIX60750.1 hypothetical protein HER32_05995 [Hymenobacter sp. BT18]